MSYILDALKKAEAQRTLGTLPNIHAPTAFAATPNDRASLWRRAWRWGALTALVIILVALAWFRPWQRAAVLPKVAPSVSTQSALSAPAAVPTVPPTVRAAQKPPAPPAPKITPKAVPAEASKPKAATSSTPTSRPKQKPQPQPQPVATIAPPVQKATPTPPANADTPEPALQSLRELPAQIQREIPPVAISGYIYSSNRAERSLLINNQLLREGDSVAPGLILEKMLPRAVVLNYQGYRYRMPY